VREQKAILAVIQDDKGRFLVTYNAKWNGYAFPMIALPEEGDILGSLAVQAAEHDLGCILPDAVTAELDYICYFGVSNRTGEETQYECWLYSVEPNQTLDLLSAPSWNNNPPMFLTFEELSSRTDLTWSTPAIAREFVENQEAVLAVITRAGQRETEFLLIDNANYGGYFFPTQRVKTEVKPDQVAKGTVRADLGYRGLALPAYLGEIADVHFSNRFFRDRNYRFHICEVQLPDVDLHQPGNILERAMTRRGKQFLWLPASRLNDPAVAFSPTIPAIAPSVLKAVPTRTFAKPLRHSEGGIVLIQRTVGGRKQWLAQWNENWKAFFFIGGHREDDETFRDCVIREIKEELGLDPIDCPVAATVASRVEYKAISKSASELTEYIMELYCAQPNPTGLKKIADNPKNKWLDEDEIERQESHDARRVSVSMQVILDLAEWPDCRMSAD
jgi:ADP-ribose pyrophosphatase YjhB (NUDIX family)